MTHLRKMITKEMQEEQLNQVLLSEDEDNVPLSKLKCLKRNRKMEKKHIKGKECSEETPMKKKAKSDWKPEDCAQSIGKMIKATGEGKMKKCHFEKFEFNGKQYELEDSVLLCPEKAGQKSYVAIIKDIYIQGKEGYVKLEVQWYYRPNDVKKKSIRNWKSKDSYSRNLFYSFHRDEVCAESVESSCIVHFVPENIPIPNPNEHHSFIVEYVYDTINEKLKKFTHKDFNEQQKYEIDLLVAKTISLISDPYVTKKEETRNLVSRRKRSVPKRLIAKPERMSPERSSVANPLDLLVDVLELVP